jgi:hypothetical protein
VRRLLPRGPDGNANGEPVVRAGLKAGATDDGGASAPDAPPGRGGGRGRGGPEILAGGPQLDDPAYANVDFAKKAPVPALTPEQELTKFVLQPGYHLELVLSDPIIQEPTAIAFDGTGGCSCSKTAATCRT